MVGKVSVVFLTPVNTHEHYQTTQSPTVLTWSILMIGSFSSTSFSITDTLTTPLDNDSLLQGKVVSQFTILALLQSLSGRFLRLGALERS